MRIQSISFADFRNYERLQLDGLGELTVFVGRNAIGKTNILEGVQLLTSASSFRHPQIAQLVREGRPGARIALEAGDGNRQISTALALEAGKRRYTVNGKPKQAADVRGLLPSVAFTPDDLQLAKKSSGVKRTALDDLGVQLTRNYYIVRRDFEKTVRYKNRLLRDDASQALIDSINETLVTCGAQLYCLRRALFARLVPHVARAYADLSHGNEPFEATYTPSWDRWDSPVRPSNAHDVPAGASGPSVPDARERMAKELQRFAAEERRRGRCLIGPHADEIAFTLDGRDASTFASQGQQRSIVLAWKLAEVQMVREVLGTAPVLLLDDVLSELDGHRREMLVSFVTEDVQTFITATDLDGFAPDLLHRAQVIHLPLHRAL